MHHQARKHLFVPALGRALDLLIDACPVTIISHKLYSAISQKPERTMIHFPVKLLIPMEDGVAMSQSGWLAGYRSARFTGRKEQDLNSDNSSIEDFENQILTYIRWVDYGSSCTCSLPICSNRRKGP